MSNHIVLHGTPGAGKTYNAKQLVGRYPDQIQHISIGDRLRAIRSGDIPSMYKEAIDLQAESLAKSAPLDHEVVNGVIFEFVRQCPATSTILIDGFPRFLDQLPLYLESIQQEGHNLLGIVHLFVSKPVCVARLTGRGSRKGETEVTEDFASWRYDEYVKKTAPTIDALGSHSRAVRIDAEPPIEVVWESFHRGIQQLVPVKL